MKMFLFLALAAFWPLLAIGEDIKLASGQIVRGEISRVEPDGLVVLTDAGVEKISFLALPEETQKRYGFDLAKADQHRAAQRAAQRQMLEQQIAAMRERAARLAEMERNQPTAEETERRIKVEASGFVARTKILSHSAKGARVTLTTQTGRAASTMLDRDSRAIVDLGEGFVYDLEGATGDIWTGRLYSAGYYSYINVFGEEQTLHGYAMTVETALAKGGNGRVVAAGTSAPGSTGGYGLPGNLRGETMLNRK